MKAFFTAAAIVLASLSLAQHVRFVVTGDDRGKDNGVNVESLKRVVQGVLSEKPDVVLINGDSIAGSASDEKEASQFKTFLSAVQPLYDAKIRVLTVRGNHEMAAKNANKLWQDTFSGQYANPDNGPAGEKDMSYSYEQGNCLFIGLDQFATADRVINQSWLDQTLAASKATHVFTFAHESAFFSGLHTDGMYTSPDTRDKFLLSLANHGDAMAFFGHDHLYDHVAARYEGWPAGKVINQIVIGTAGAPFYHGHPSDPTDGKWSLTHLGHIEDRLGYAVVDVDGADVKVVFKAETQPGQFDIADKFSYSAG